MGFGPPDYFHSLKRRDVYAAVMDRFHTRPAAYATTLSKIYHVNSPARSLAAKVSASLLDSSGTSHIEGATRGLPHRWNHLASSGRAAFPREKS